MKRFLLSFLLIAVSLTARADSVLSLSNAWVREGPPTAKVLAGFMIINNRSDKDIQITGAESEDFERVELHRTIIEGGMASMVKQESITVPANGEIELEPGSYHLMLIGAKRTLSAGDMVPIQLFSEAGYCITESLEVKKGDDDSIDDHSHHHHHH